MLSSILSIVDSVLTLDEGFSRKDIIAGDLVVIDGNLNKDVAGRISGTASLACIWNAEKKRRFFIIVGKHKIELHGSMDMNPKPLSMVNPNHTTVRITNDQNRYLEIRFNDAVSFSIWLPKLGEALAESMCNEVLASHHTANSIACLNMRRCIHTCELLTSPSKVYVRRVSEIYSIRRKLMEVMSTLRSNPCDVNIKDLRSLKELCWKYPEMQSDPDMKFLLERMPSDRYNSEDLQAILKDILYTEPGDGSGLACAHLYHGTDSSADQIALDDSFAMARAVLVRDTQLSSTYCSSHFIDPLSCGQLSSTVLSEGEDRGSSHCLNSTTVSSTAATDAPQATVPVPVHRKSRIMLNGVEIQSTSRSPSSAGKALSKQIKIKSKFTTPSQPRKEILRPKTKTPPSNKKSILAEVQYNVSSVSSSVNVLPSPLPVSAPLVEPALTPAQTPVSHGGFRSSSDKAFTPVTTVYDKENVPTPHRNSASASMPRSALKKPSSAGKSSQHKLSFAANLEAPRASLLSSPITSVLEFKSVELNTLECREDVVALTGLGALETSDSILQMDILPELVAPTESAFGTPQHHSVSKVPFASPSRAHYSIQNVASLFDDAVVYAISASLEPLALKGSKDGKIRPSESTMTPIGRRAVALQGCTDPQSCQKTNASGLESEPLATLSSPVVKQAVAPVLHSPEVEVALQTMIAPIQQVMESTNTVNPAPLAPFVSVASISLTSAKASSMSAQHGLSPVVTVRQSHSENLFDITLPVSATPAKSHRVMHLTTPSTGQAGVSAATAAPRTPAPLLPAIPLLTSLPLPTSLTVSAQTVVSPKMETVDGGDDYFGRHLHGKMSFRMIAFVLCFTIAALYLGRYSASTGPVHAAPMVAHGTLQMNVPTVPLLSQTKGMSEPVINTVDAFPVAAQPLWPVETVETAKTSAEVSTQEKGFEMHVRFEGASDATRDSQSTSSAPLAAQQQHQQRSIQLYRSSQWLTQLRRLQRLLTLPAKYACTVFNTVWKKLERIRRVLAE